MLRVFLFITLCIGIVFSASARVAIAEDSPRILSTSIKGPIGIGAERHLFQAIEKAEQDGYTLLIIQLDTPGGLYDTTRNMVQAILNSPVPITVYVAPSGAHAASAGFFLVYAADIAAMAPATNLGSATPISLGGNSDVMPQRSHGKSVLEKKALNDSIAFIKSLAEENGRNVQYAIKGVLEALNLSAQEALKHNVINIIAESEEILLQKINGTKIRMGEKEHVINTKDVSIDYFEPDMRTEIIKILTDPNIIYILLMLGFYGLLLEFYAPGTFVPGVVGAISLCVALWAMSILPTNYFGVALIVLGLSFMVAELHIPSFGVLGIGGLVCLGFGSYMLFDDPYFKVDPTFLGTFLVTTAIIVFLLAGYLVKVNTRAKKTGKETMIGQKVTVISWEGGKGQVKYHGEIWQAEAAAMDKRKIKKGMRLAIKNIRGLTIKV